MLLWPGGLPLRLRAAGPKPRCWRRVPVPSPSLDGASGTGCERRRGAVPCRAVPCSRAATQLPSAASLPDQGGQRDAVTPLQPRSRLPRESSPSALLRKKPPFLFKSVSLSPSLCFSQCCLIAARKRPRWPHLPSSPPPKRGGHQAEGCAPAQLSCLGSVPLLLLYPLGAGIGCRRGGSSSVCPRHEAGLQLMPHGSVCRIPSWTMGAAALRWGLISSPRPRSLRQPPLAGCHLKLRGR